jgi:hypothetical protein
MGRKLKYQTLEELETEIAAYFELIKAENKYATITGLALYLGFESRQSLYEYEQMDEYAYAIKRARLQIENVYENHLHYKNPAGAIFGLKNMGWTDRQEISHVGIPDPVIKVHIEKPDE